MSFAHLSRPLRSVAQKTFTRKFVTLGRIMAFWPDVVGEQLAAKTAPISMSVRKTGKNEKTTKNLVATLTVSASSAEATLLTYQKSLILERINTMLGQNIVVDLKIIHGAPGLQRRMLAAPPARKAGTAAAPIAEGDPELRTALENLGRWINE